MLSICIPHYNFKNPNLFNALQLQCLTLKIDFEILIIDDASDSINNSYLNQLAEPYFNIIYLEENIGRAAIRNLLAQKAKYQNLLFLDADSEIIMPDFIKNYLKYIDADVVCGGREYPSEKPEDGYLIHWNYGRNVEQKVLVNFHSNNFLIKKQIFNNIKFNEALTQYGYEDVVFGLAIKNLGYQILNIDNPVKHIDIKNNKQFLDDTKSALQNLVFLLGNQSRLGLQNEVKIVKQYQKFCALGIQQLLSIKNDSVLNKLTEILLRPRVPFKNLLFAIYKLYYFHSIYKNS